MDKPEWYLERAPLGQVPALELLDGRILFESDVISDYLDEAYPEHRIVPDDPFARAELKIQRAPWSNVRHSAMSHSQTYSAFCFMVSFIYICENDHKNHLILKYVLKENKNLQSYETQLAKCSEETPSLISVRTTDRLHEVRGCFKSAYVLVIFRAFQVSFLNKLYTSFYVDLQFLTIYLTHTFKEKFYMMLTI